MIDECIVGLAGKHLNCSCNSCCGICGAYTVQQQMFSSEISHMLLLSCDEPKTVNRLLAGQPAFWPPTPTFPLHLVLYFRARPQGNCLIHFLSCNKLRSRRAELTGFFSIIYHALKSLRIRINIVRYRGGVEVNVTHRVSTSTNWKGFRVFLSEKLEEIEPYQKSGYELERTV
ncbi:hypothetical protein J6590_062252 [Homalodisca vitripennis]|nr:hypothetical protein J6590_062252 [Homalodisca vitripennis]